MACKFPLKKCNCFSHKPVCPSLQVSWDPEFFPCALSFSQLQRRGCWCQLSALVSHRACIFTAGFLDPNCILSCLPLPGARDFQDAVMSLSTELQMRTEVSRSLGRRKLGKKPPWRHFLTPSAVNTSIQPVSTWPKDSQSAGWQVTWDTSSVAGDLGRMCSLIKVSKMQFRVGNHVTEKSNTCCFHSTR